MTEVKDHINITEQTAKLWKILEEVYDPEIPVLSIVDLGIVRDVKLSINDKEELAGAITITPTYSGCPAMDVISMHIKMALLENGYRGIQIKQQLSPAWTTDWMSQKGKEKLSSYGITPPTGTINEDPIVPCPLCHSTNTTLISQFGSTACKALYKCLDCREPFDYFKCH